MSAQSKRKAASKAGSSKATVKKSGRKSPTPKTTGKAAKKPAVKKTVKKSVKKTAKNSVENSVKKKTVKKSVRKTTAKTTDKTTGKATDTITDKTADKITNKKSVTQKVAHKSSVQNSPTKTEAKTGQNAPRLWLVDGSGYIFRAFYAIPTRMTRDKMPVNAVFGFTNMLLRLRQSIASQDCITVVFDAGSHSFRNDIYPEYKANRDETPPDLVPQFAATREAATALGFPVVERADVEADDVIATYARIAEAQKMEAVIVSSDKDLMQLVRPGVSMWDPMKEKNLGEAEVLEKFGVPPRLVADVQALAGDTSDNVPGVPGIGVKTAALLIHQFGDLESVLTRAEEITQPKRRQALVDYAEQARLCLRLVRLADDLDLPLTLDELHAQRRDPALLRSFLEKYEFRSILARLERDGTLEPTTSPTGTKSPTGATTGAGSVPNPSDGAPVAPDGASEATGGTTGGIWGKGATGGHTGGYSLIQDEATLAAWLATACADGLLCLDTETTDLNPERAELVGVSLALLDGRAGYVPIAHRKPVDALQTDALDTGASTEASTEAGADSATEANQAQEQAGENATGESVKQAGKKITKKTLKKTLKNTVKKTAQKAAQKSAQQTGLFQTQDTEEDIEEDTETKTDTEATEGIEDSVSKEDSASKKEDNHLLPNQLSLAQVRALLAPVLGDSSVLKIGHNIKYDLRVLRHHGMEVIGLDDTMLLSYVLDAGTGSHAMDALAKRHLDRTAISYSEVTKPASGRKQLRFDEVALDKACEYASEDADITLELWRKLRPRVQAENRMQVYETLERPLVPVLQTMEAAGILLDADTLRELSEDFQIRATELEAECHKLAGREFALGSPKQLGAVLFDELDLPYGGRKGKSGAKSTDHMVLEDLAAQGFDIADKVLAWRSLTKLRSTYTEALLDSMEPTGRVHTHFGQTGASTGRLSSSNPNLQNIPIRTADGRRIREAFVAAPGHLLLSVDYSQIELRLAAEITDEPALKRAFAEGADIHAATAAEMFHLPLDKVTPDRRREAKAINFGIIYGISPFGLARGLKIPQEEARAFMDTYFARYPQIAAWMEATRQQVRKTGQVETLFGRVIHLPSARSSNHQQRAFAERAAINAPIQGTAADIIKRAMIRLPDALQEARLRAKLLLQVHDELVLEVPEDELEKTASLVAQIMEQAPLPACPLSVPLVADTNAAETWGKAH